MPISGETRINGAVTEASRFFCAENRGLRKSNENDNKNMYL